MSGLVVEKKPPEGGTQNSENIDEMTNMPMYEICEVKVEPDYKLRLTYTDGKTIVANFKPLIESGGVYAQLADPAMFAQAALDERGRFIHWQDEIDFCADGLRLHNSREESEVA